jgi:NTP pyrophosphatase (non-canonical NTP hydrolase)
MEIRELQDIIKEYVSQMDEKYKCTHDSEATFNHIIEEIGELAREINKPKIRNQQIIKQEISNEIADVFILLIHLCSVHDIDVEECILYKMQELKQRNNLE